MDIVKHLRTLAANRLLGEVLPPFAEVEAMEAAAKEIEWLRELLAMASGARCACGITGKCNCSGGGA